MAKKIHIDTSNDEFRPVKSGFLETTFVTGSALAAVYVIITTLQVASDIDEKQAAAVRGLSDTKVIKIEKVLDDKGQYERTHPNGNYEKDETVPLEDRKIAEELIKKGFFMSPAYHGKIKARANDIRKKASKKVSEARYELMNRNALYGRSGGRDYVAQNKHYRNIPSTVYHQRNLPPHQNACRKG